MDQSKIERINFLAKKAKAQGLTPQETLERDGLRKEYITAFRSSLKATLDNTYIVDDKGGKRKLEQRRGEDNA